MLLQKYILLKLDSILSFGKKATGGRNFFGRICIHHRGCLNKRIYRFIDFFRRGNMWGIVLSNKYDPNRTAYIRPLLYENGLLTYIISASRIKDKTYVFSGPTYLYVELPAGSATTLNNIPLFTLISMIEYRPFFGAQLCRSGGTKCLFIGRKDNKAILKLPSKWQIKVSLNSMAMVGQISNASHKFNIIGKAGKSRALGFRPTVRGVAKNPCDHPHGGGNGKKSHPPVPVTAWGRWAKNTPTTQTLFAMERRHLFKKLK